MIMFRPSSVDVTSKQAGSVGTRPTSEWYRTASKLPGGSPAKTPLPSCVIWDTLPCMISLAWLTVPPYTSNMHWWPAVVDIWRHAGAEGEDHGGEGSGAGRLQGLQATGQRTKAHAKNRDFARERLDDVIRDPSLRRIARAW
jgi:hypothetical protein